ncbi:hypothetical protein GF337_07150, partial [candidate division KSB1 bacterium]|nr:hypothetical protein [candidate division KSB1 bacterium]
MRSKIIVFFCIYFLCLVFSSSYSQDTTGELYILSDIVGEEIDMLERQKYTLFPNIQGFQYARFYTLPDSSYIVELVTKDATDGTINTKRLPRSEEMIMNYKRKIEGEIFQATPADTLYTVKLRDGNTLQGRIIQRDEESISIRTPAGLEIRAPRKSIISMKPLRGKMVGDQYFRVDPNYSRLLFAPTGRPLQKGDGYFSDYYVFFPGVAYGFTDYFSLMAGFSVIPGLSISEQLKYFAPRIGKQFSDNFALSAGALYMSLIEEVAAGVAFGVATFGQPDKSFTVGLGYGYAKEEDED